MATRFITTDTIGTGIIAPISLAEGDGALIAQGITLGATDYAALYGVDSYHRVMVLGTVYGGTYGMLLGDSPTFNTGQRVLVGASGVVGAISNAVALYGSNSSVTNHGLISGGTTAVLRGHRGKRHTFHPRWCRR